MQARTPAVRRAKHRIHVLNPSDGIPNGFRAPNAGRSRRACGEPVGRKRG
ncbi:hypothetical protein BURPS305_0653 [Burkholderia pseudomallei 305]|uniref:Uncharacterized protein n=1 Tax=Burkholderia pseudomallei 1710a TaxID=320371 RepID=A0A0E1WA97_BURPE|nr:hypothetical protein GBP346_A0235 [Burkholderia pseudomallei MSHR346]EBA45107.1 hypothetical protein BURPS305_0653 [Burkholderia pseudomallei 305]EET10175.1 hypothetical protein BURPS1710A_0586 [Burkholderia pseudomallei 1710a]